MNIKVIVLTFVLMTTVTLSKANWDWELLQLALTKCLIEQTN